jgi:hypothetical protein
MRIWSLQTNYCLLQLETCRAPNTEWRPGGVGGGGYNLTSPFTRSESINFLESGRGYENDKVYSPKHIDIIATRMNIGSKSCIRERMTTAYTLICAYLCLFNDVSQTIQF